MGFKKKSKPWNWTGRPVLASNGYLLVFVGKAHHLSDVRGYAYQHRIVAEKKIGRRLRNGEQVHHINGVKTDNRPSNIQVFETISHHRAAHRKVGFDRRIPGEKNCFVFCACGCGTRFRKFDDSGRPRMFVSGHNMKKGGAQCHPK